MAEVFIEGRYYGQMNLPFGRVGRELARPEGAVFVCPTCGQAWAQVLEEGRHHQPYSVGCSKHPHWEVPGSLWLSWDANWNAALPPAVIQREFTLALSAWSRENENG